MCAIHTMRNTNNLVNLETRPLSLLIQYEKIFCKKYQKPGILILCLFDSEHGVPPLRPRSRGLLNTNDSYYHMKL